MKLNPVVAIIIAVLTGLLAGCSDRDATNDQANDKEPNNAQASDREPAPKNYAVIEGEIKRSMSMTMTGRGQMQANPPDLTLVASDGKEYPVRRMPGCTGGPAEASGGVIRLGGLGRYRCKGVIAGSVFEVYEMTKL